MDKIKIVIGLVVIGVLAFFFMGNRPQITDGTSCKNCNVIVVGVDTLRADHMSAIGYNRNTTPTLDAIAKEGALFSQAVAPASWTVPSFMGVMTGTHPSVHGVVNKFTVFNKTEQKFSNLKEISPNIGTLAEALKKAGYATGGFTGDAGVSAKFGYNQGFDVFTDEQTFGGFNNSDTHAIKWLDSLQKGQKFFMFFHGYDLHGQFAVSNDYKSIYASRNYDGPYTGTPQEQAKLREDQLVGPIKLTSADVEFWKSLYDSKLHDADARLANFLQQLDQRGLLKNTVIVVVSDHGEEFYEHKGFDHGQSLYDELIHVPLIIKVPGMKGGEIVSGQVSTIDVMPTLLKILDVTPDANLAVQIQSRKNLLDYIKNPALPGYDVFSETDYRDFTHMRSIRTADGWKFIRTLQTGKEQLYNISADPSELKNLITTDLVKTAELRAALDAHIRDDLHADPNARPSIGCLPVYNGECISK